MIASHITLGCNLIVYPCPIFSGSLAKPLLKFKAWMSAYIPQKTGCTLQWRHNVRDGVSNHQPHDCLLNRLFRRRSKETSKLRVTGICEGNSPVTGEFPTQRASNAGNVAIWWRHHEYFYLPQSLIVYIGKRDPNKILNTTISQSWADFIPLTWRWPDTDLMIADQPTS